MKKTIDGESVFIFWDSIEHYPSWIQNNSEYVWPFVAEATKTNKSPCLELKLRDGSIFTVIQKHNTNWEREDCLDVELYYNKKIVSAFRVVNKFYRTGDYYELSDVEFIKSGEWQKKISTFIKWKANNDKMMEHKRNEELKDYREGKMNKSLE